MGLNELAKEIHKGNCDRGFWDNPREKGTILMLCVSELSEALEADRKCRYSNWPYFKFDESTVYDFKESFEKNIKDTFEDEITDTLIRILDLCAAYNIDIEKHVKYKLAYNATRERLHGKQY